MEVFTKKRLQLFSGRAHPELADEIGLALGVPLGETNLVDFANGEIRCRFGESVRGCDVFIIQSHTQTAELSLNDSVMEQLIMIDAAKRASAKRITAVAPFFGYARQDRKSSGREPITAKLLSDMFRVAGADRIVSVDLHSGQIQGFFDGPVDHLTAMPVLLDYLRRNLDGEVVIVSPDSGRVKVAERYANHLGAEVASIYKRRNRGAVNEVQALGIMGEVTGRTAVIVDDMIDTAGTMCQAAEQLVAAGAVEVVAMATHGLFSGPAVDRLKNAPIAKVVVTNTLPLPPEKVFPALEVLTAASVIADALDAVFEDTSVSEIFGGENVS